MRQFISRLKSQVFLAQLINALQNINFTFEDASYEALLARWPKHGSYLRWWTSYGTMHCLNISYNKGLKEFILQNPIPFKVSSECAFYAKHELQKEILRQGSIKHDMVIVGVRSAEGGARQYAYKDTLSRCIGSDVYNFRPILYFRNEDKAQYCRENGIIHSRAYTDMGLKRTGCCLCPCNRDLLTDLDIIKRFEPDAFQKAYEVFHDSIEYTIKYRKFVRKYF